MKRTQLALAAVMVVSGGAQAAGFALYEHSASALGNAFAGQAVVARDASTIFANPAGLTQVQGHQVVGGVQLIKSSVHFTESDGDPSGGDGGGLSVVPSFYYAMDLTPDVKVGIGVFGPFGLKTEYDSDWAGRANGILSDMKTINVNPTVAWKVNDKLSVGVGVDFQYVEATLSKAPYPIGHPYEALVSTMEGDDTSWGWNVGAHYQVDAATWIGLSYRSTVNYRLKGDLRNNLTGYMYDIRADVTLPDMASLALLRRIDDRWTIMADATWTGWSEFDKLDVHRAVDGQLVDHTEENWQDAWRFGVGADYRYNDAWTWRFGVAYDNTPIPDADHRTPRIPDSDRISVAVGGQFRASKQAVVDFGYMHIFFHDSQTTSPAGGYQGKADILGAQLSYSY
jgi:long-chain fatty acid transport protein